MTTQPSLDVTLSGNPLHQWLYCTSTTCPSTYVHTVTHVQLYTGEWKFKIHSSNSYTSIFSSVVKIVMHCVSCVNNCFVMRQQNTAAYTYRRANLLKVSLIWTVYTLSPSKNVVANIFHIGEDGKIFIDVLAYVFREGILNFYIVFVYSYPLVN